MVWKEAAAKNCNYNRVTLYMHWAYTNSAINIQWTVQIVWVILSTNSLSEDLPRSKHRIGLTIMLSRRSAIFNLFHVTLHWQGIKTEKVQNQFLTIDKAHMVFVKGLINDALWSPMAHPQTPCGTPVCHGSGWKLLPKLVSVSTCLSYDEHLATLNAILPNSL